MASPLATVAGGTKRSALAVIIILLVMVGLAGTLASQMMEKAMPGASAPAVASSIEKIDASAAAALSSNVPQSAPLAQPQVDVLLLQLEEAWRKSDWPKAIEVLTVLVTSDPANAQVRERLYQARVNFGWQLLVSQQFEEARTQFNLALQIRPDGAEAREGLRLLQQLAVTVVAAAPAAAVVAAATCTPTPAVVVVATPCPQQVVVAACPPSSVIAPSGFIVHVVQPGDNLFRLAIRFNTTVAAIQAANRLSSTTIFVCQTLLIPVCPTQLVCPTSCPPTCVPVCPTPCPPTCVPVCPTLCPQACPSAVVRVHVVQRGDSLFRLALRFNVSVAVLMQANGLQTTQIRVGQTLIIPCDP